MNPQHQLRDNAAHWWLNLDKENKELYRTNLFKGCKFITMSNIDNAYMLCKGIETYFGKEEVSWRVIAFGLLLPN